ncbi:MAG: phage tail tape measure protein, partial [Deinococcota bacterium]
MDDVFELQGTLSLDGSDFRRSLQNAERQAETSSGRIGGAFARVNDVLSVAAGNLLARGFEASITGINNATTAVIDFESGFREVTTLFNDLPADAPFFDQLEDDLVNFQTEFGVLSGESIPALYQSISAGVPPDNVISFLEQAAQSAQAGATNITTAVDGISSVVNAYGADVISATEVSDLLFAAVQGGKTDFAQLSANMSTVTGAANSAGIAFDNVTAALATITSTGTTTNVAATQLRSLINELADSGSNVSEVFQNLDAGALKPAGESFTDFIARGGDLNEALALLSGAADASGIAIGELFGSVEASQAAFVLGVSGATKFGEELDRAASSAGSTEAAFEKMGTTTRQSLNEISALGEALLLDLGNSILPALNQGLSGVADSAPDIRERLQPAFDDLGTSIQTATTNTGDFVAGFSGVGDVESEFARIGEATRTTLDTLTELTEITFSPLADSLSGVSFDVFSDGQAAFDEFVVGLENLDDLSFDNVADLSSDLVADLIGGFSDGLQDLTAAGGDLLDGVVDGVRDNAPAMIDAAGTITQSLLTAVQEQGFSLVEAGAPLVANIGAGIVENLPGVLEQGRNIVGSLLSGFNDNLPALAEAGGQAIGELVGSLVANAPAIAAEGFQLIGVLVRGILEALPTIIEAGVSVMGGLIQGVSNSFPEWLSNAKQLPGVFASEIGNNLGALLNAGAQIVQEILAGLAGLGAQLAIAGREAIDELINASIEQIQQKAGVVGRAIEDIFTGGNASEARRIAEIAGGETIDAYVDGVVSADTSATRTVFAKILDGAALNRNDLRAAGRLLSAEYINGLDEGVKANLQQAVQASSSLANALDDGARDALGIQSPSTKGMDVGRFYVSGMSTGITNNISQIVAAAQTAAGVVDSTVRATLQINSDSQRAIETSGFYNAGLASGMDNTRDVVEASARATADVIDDTLRQAAVDFRNNLDTLLGQNLLGNIDTSDAIAELETLRTSLESQAQALAQAGNADSDEFRQFIDQIQDLDSEITFLTSEVDNLAESNRQAAVEGVKLAGEQREMADAAVSFADAISGQAVVEAEVNQQRAESAARIYEARQATDDYATSAGALSDTLSSLNAQAADHNTAVRETAQANERAAQAMSYAESFIFSSLDAATQMGEQQAQTRAQIEAGREATADYASSLNALNNMSRTATNLERDRADAAAYTSDVLDQANSTILSSLDAATQSSVKSLEQFEAFRSLRGEIGALNAEPLTVFEQMRADLEMAARLTEISEGQLEQLNEQLDETEQAVQAINFDNFTQDIEALTGDAPTRLERLVTKIESAGEAGKLSADQVAELVAQVEQLEQASNATDKLVGDLQLVSDGVTSLTGSLANFGVDTTSLDFVSGSIDGIIGKLDEVGINAFSAGDAFGAIATAAQSSSNSAISALGGLANAAMQFASGNILGGVIGGVTSIIGGISSIFGGGGDKKRIEEMREASERLNETAAKLTDTLEGTGQAAQFYIDRIKSGAVTAEQLTQANRDIDEFVRMTGDAFRSLDDLDDTVGFDLFDEFQQINVGELEALSPVLGELGAQYQELI